MSRAHHDVDVRGLRPAGLPAPAAPFDVATGSRPGRGSDLHLRRAARTAPLARTA